MDVQLGIFILKQATIEGLGKVSDLQALIVNQKINQTFNKFVVSQRNFVAEVSIAIKLKSTASDV